MSLNDVAVGLVADHARHALSATGRRSALPGASPVILLRMPETIKDALEAETQRSGDTLNDVVLRVLAEELGVPFQSTDHAGGQSPCGGSPAERNQWPQPTAPRTSARKKDKVRVAIVGVGNCANSLLQGVEYYKDADRGRDSPGSHARRPRRVPHLGHRVRGRVRRRQGQGRRRPRRRDLGPPNDTIKFAP